jgi:hypothetical protein
MSAGFAAAAGGFSCIELAKAGPGMRRKAQARNSWRHWM